MCIQRHEQSSLEQSWVSDIYEDERRKLGALFELFNPRSVRTQGWEWEPVRTGTNYPGSSGYPNGQESHSQSVVLDVFNREHMIRSIKQARTKLFEHVSWHRSIMFELCS